MVELQVHDSPEHMLSAASKITYRKTGSALARAGNGLRLRRNSKHQTDLDVSWGRAPQATWSAIVSCLSIMLFGPVLVLFYSIALSHYDSSLLDAAIAMCTENPWTFAMRNVSALCAKTLGVYALWVLYQAALFQYLPAKLSTGQLTPAGHLLQYHTNGLSAYMITHIMLVLAVCFGVFDPAWIAKNWSGLLVATNVYGFALAAFAYTKAFINPTHAKDRKFSGSMIYDFMMGIEFNPRFGQYWDFKLFFVGRPGMIAWTVIDLSFTAYQYEKFGYITNSMVIVNILHAIYCIDFLINEDWYLRTIDICHDHFGFYLGWGAVTWLPAMYTLQAQYLAYHPVSFSPPVATTILATGVAGYCIFRSVNHQKDIVRRTKGDCLIWGRPAGVLECKYKTSDGKEHQSLLLYTGWWGFSRHANYLGDLILSYAMCATCGFDHVFPWFYAIFMTVLLLHRSNRSERSCAAKYGKDWGTYCEKVRWVLIPGVY